MNNKFYIKLVKLRLQDENIEIYSTIMEGKSVVAEPFLTTLNNDIYKYMTSISKSIYIDKLSDNKPKTYVDCLVKLNTKIHKYRLADHARISKCKILSSKD